MPALTPTLLQRLRDTVAKHHSAFVVRVFGPKAVPEPTLQKLKSEGLIPETTESLEDAYLYGRVMSALEDPEVAKWPLEKVRAYLKKNPVPLSPAEQAAVDAASLTGAAYVTALGDDVAKDVAQEAIRAATTEGLGLRLSGKSLKAALGNATQEWERNLDRVAITEKQSAMQQGVADGIRQKGGKDALVAFLVAPDACAHCKRLHVGPDGRPRVFKLSQLAGAGVNVKKKPSAWVACTGTIHPHCQCRMVRIPEGWGFNDEGTLVPGGKLGEPYDPDLNKARKLARKMVFQGFPISIETDVGQHREWHDPHSGESGKTEMKLPYGYVRGTEAADGDHVDVYVGPHENADHVFIVHQRKKRKDGSFSGYDEDKVFLGMRSAAEAKSAYLAHYNNPGFFGAMSALPVEAFRSALKVTRGKRVHGIPVPFPEHGDEPHIRKSAVRFTLGKAGPLNPQSGSLPSSVGGVVVEADGHVSTGSGINLQSEPGKQTRPIGGATDTAGMRLYLTQGMPRTSVIRRDPRIYEFDVDNPDWVNPVELDHGVMASTHDPPQEVILREDLERWLLQSTLVPRNLANPGWEPTGSQFLEGEPPRPKVQVQKSDGKSPRIADVLAYLAFRKARGELLKSAAGHKYLKKEWVHAHWVYTYADKLGGELIHHPTNLDMVAFKVPVAHAKAVDSRVDVAIPGKKVMVGKTHVAVPLSAEEVKKFGAHLGRQHWFEKLGAAPPGTKVKLAGPGWTPEAQGQVYTKQEGSYGSGKWVSGDETYTGAGLANIAGHESGPHLEVDYPAGHTPDDQALTVPDPWSSEVPEKPAPKPEPAPQSTIPSPPPPVASEPPSAAHIASEAQKMVATLPGASMLPHVKHPGKNVIAVQSSDSVAVDSLKTLAQKYGLDPPWLPKPGSSTTYLNVPKPDAPPPPPAPPVPISTGVPESSGILPGGPTVAKMAPATLPKVNPHNLGDLWQKGAQVTHSGKTGSYLGRAPGGEYVVDFGSGPQLLSSAPSLKDSAQQAKHPAHGMHPGKTLKALPEYAALVKDALKAALPGAPKGTVGKTYADWLYKQGHDVFLVGGIVRDMIAGVASGKPHKQVLAEMTDVDFATTAGPQTLKACHAALAPGSQHHVHGGHLQNGIAPGDAQGTVDLASLSNTGNTPGGAPTNAFDHDAEGDANRRDFTVNAVFYDVHNDALLDPSGTGIEDAANHVLRRLPGKEWQQDKRMAARFWKFRARGWTGEDATTKAVVKMAEKFWPGLGSGMIAEQVAHQLKKEPDAAKAVKEFKATMKADGAGHLWDKYLAGQEAALIAKIKSKHG